MKDFKRSNDRGRDDRGGRSFGGGSFGGGNKFSGDRSRSRGGFGGGNRDNGERPMFAAVCDDCGKPCQVPFRPSGDKPVRCNDCFGNSRDNGGRDDRGGRDFKKPAFSKNVYRDTPQQSTPDFKSDFIALGQKLDTVISLLQGMQPAKKELGEIIKSAVETKVLSKTKKEVVKKVTPVKKVATNPSSRKATKGQEKVAKVVTKVVAKKAVKKVTKK